MTSLFPQKVFSQGGIKEKSGAANMRLKGINSESCKDPSNLSKEKIGPFIFQIRFSLGLEGIKNEVPKVPV